MPRPSHRDKIVSEGLKVILERGYCGASVRDIVQAAGAPQGSFTNHFGSKEEFGLEVLNLYYSLLCANTRETLANDTLPPLVRLQLWIDLQREFLERGDMRSGCLIGNFSIEAGDNSEKIRLRLVEIVGELQHAIAECLQAAAQNGDISPETDCPELAAFLYTSLQGAILQSKVERNASSIERFKHYLFSSVLR